MKATRKSLKAWLPSLFWLALIVLESTNWFSADNTSRILYPIFHFLTGVDRVGFAIWDFYIRKTGHVVGYFVLSWLMFNSLRASLASGPVQRWAFRWARIAFLFTAMVATLDEWHQTYLASRTGRWQDVVLDSSAALAAQILLFFRARFGSPRGTMTADEPAEANTSSRTW